MFQREMGRVEARGMQAQSQGGRLQFPSPGTPIAQLQPMS